MAYKINDVVFFALCICRRNDAYGFVESDVDVLLLGLSYQLAIHAYLILGKDLGTQFGNLPIDGDPFLFQKPICSSTRAKAYFAEVFIDSNGGLLTHKTRQYAIELAS
jgi:hypothetical protein